MATEGQGNGRMSAETSGPVESISLRQVEEYCIMTTPMNLRTRTATLLSVGSGLEVSRKVGPLDEDL